ncbi:T9SS type A sorting domain-containing protein, partial [bacterium]|nr:T9SS type A sorting domain-containing protein [bacterium]
LCFNSPGLSQVPGSETLYSGDKPAEMAIPNPVIDIDFNGDLLTDQFGNREAHLSLRAMPLIPQSFHTLRLKWDPTCYTLNRYSLGAKASPEIEIVEGFNELVIYPASDEPLDLSLTFIVNSFEGICPGFHIDALSGIIGDQKSNNTINLFTMHKDLVLSGEPQRIYSALPTQLQLSQNQPNPFNPSTGVEYALPCDCAVEISVYDILGEKVCDIEKGSKTAGYHQAFWAGRNSLNEPVSSGIYFIKLTAGEEVRVIKTQLIK